MFDGLVLENKDVAGPLGANTAGLGYKHDFDGLSAIWRCLWGAHWIYLSCDESDDTNCNPMLRTVVV